MLVKVYINRPNFDWWTLRIEMTTDSLKVCHTISEPYLLTQQTWEDLADGMETSTRCITLKDGCYLLESERESGDGNDCKTTIEIVKEDLMVPLGDAIREAIFKEYCFAES